MKTWSGNIRNNKPKLVCKIDGRTQVRHIVKIRNGKTVKRKVKITGKIKEKRAYFNGNSSVVKINDEEWESCQLILGNYERIIKDVEIKKNTTGDDIIQVEIEYQDLWNSTQKKRADEDKLYFTVDLI